MALVNIDPTTGLPIEGFDDGTGSTIPGLGNNPPDPGDGPVFPPSVQPVTTPVLPTTPPDPAGPPPAPIGGTSALGLPATPGYTFDPITGQYTYDATVAGAVDEGNLSGVDIGPTDAVTRQVQDEELVANQLGGLLSGDSSYIQNARQRAAELSNRRGQFTSNLFAGAAERSAIEAALPIAQNDAQAFRDAAAQNLVARNQNAIANIQRAASLDTALLSSRTSISLANLDAATRVGISNSDRLATIDMANLDAETQLQVTNMTNSTQLLMQQMQSELEIEMQSRNLNHDSAMEAYRQDGRLQLANLDANLRRELTAAGFTHDINMQNLSASDQRRLASITAEYQLESQNRDQNFNNRQSHINMAMQAQINYINYLSSFAGTEMDADAAAALQAQANDQLVSSYAMINGLYPNQPAIEVNFG